MWQPGNHSPGVRAGDELNTRNLEPGTPGMCVEIGHASENAFQVKTHEVEEEFLIYPKAIQFIISRKFRVLKTIVHTIK